MLAIIGTIFFFCAYEAEKVFDPGIHRLIVSPGMDLAPSPYYWPGSDEVWGNSPPLGTRSGWLALACLPFVLYAPTIRNANITLTMTQRDCKQGKLDHAGDGSIA